MRHGEKILVVEDAYLLAEMIGALLHDYGLEPAGPAGRLAQGRRPAPERASTARLCPSIGARREIAS